MDINKRLFLITNITLKHQQALTSIWCPGTKLLIKKNCYLRCRQHLKFVIRF